MYVQFGYGPQTVCNQTQRQVSGSMNIDTINAKNRSTINDAKMKTKTPKKILLNIISQENQPIEVTFKNIS